MKASVYMDNLNIDLASNAKLHGHLVKSGKSVIMTDDAQVHAEGVVVYAPNAYVQINGSSTIRGTTVADRLKIGGGAKIYSSEVDYDSSPIFGGPGNKKGPPKGNISLIRAIEN